ncbi:MAG TPA: proton-conducting transporter membrane subunit [Roseiflexaceae bacterium]|nr:proton-conducting transporter membrane subunit [Roseiflexaceae bacterium]
MIYLLLILFPVVMGASSFLLRKQTRLVIGAAALTTLVQIALAAQIPLDEPARLLGLTLTLDPLSRLFLLAFLAVGGLAFLATLRLPHGENFVPIALVILGVVCAVLLLMQEPFVVSLLLVSAGLLAVLAIVDLPTGSPGLVERAVIATALKYLVLILIAGVMMYMAFVLVNIYRPGDLPGRASPAHLILALMVVGFGLRLAVAPFHSWLPDLAEDAAPMVSVLVVAVINTTSLLFLINSFQFFPVVVLENERGLELLSGLGALTALLGALLALGQAGLRRTCGYLLVYNAGAVLLGLASATPVGLAGAVFESFNQLIAVLLLFVCIGLLERPDGRPANVVRRDLLWRWPVAGAGLIGGALALLGLPPFGGFASKLLLYHAAAGRGQAYLAALLLATAIAALALLRLARERLLGAPEGLPAAPPPPLLGETELDRPPERRLEPEPRGLALLTAGLLGLSLAIGLHPQPLLATIEEVIRGLTFVRPV